MSTSFAAASLAAFDAIVAARSEASYRTGRIMRSGGLSCKERRRTKTPNLFVTTWLDRVWITASRGQHQEVERKRRVTRAGSCSTLQGSKATTLVITAPEVTARAPRRTMACSVVGVWIRSSRSRTCSCVVGATTKRGARCNERLCSRREGTAWPLARLRSTPGVYSKYVARSTTVTRAQRCSSSAAWRPAKPAPTTTTRGRGSRARATSSAAVTAAATSANPTASARARSRGAAAAVATVAGAAGGAGSCAAVARRQNSSEASSEAPSAAARHATAPPVAGRVAPRRCGVCQDGEHTEQQLTLRAPSRCRSERRRAVRLSVSRCSELACRLARKQRAWDGAHGTAVRIDALVSAQPSAGRR